MKYLGYAWTTVVDLFSVVIVIFVLSSLHSRTEQIIVPVLGLIYTTIRTIAIGQLVGQMAVGKALAYEIFEIRKALGGVDEYAYGTELKLASEKNEQVHVKLVISSVFVGLTSLICLYFLAVAL